MVAPDPSQKNLSGNEDNQRTDADPLSSSSGQETLPQELTEQRRAEEALKESEEIFRVLAENSPIGIGLIKADVHVYVNPTFTRITGYEYHELKDQPPEIIFHPEDRAPARHRIKERLDGRRKRAQYEARVLTKSGEIRLVEVQGTRIDYQGEPAIIGTIQDITERRELQREVLQVQEEERRRLGQDLHDSLASQLTAANLKLSLLARKVDDEITDDLEEIQSIIEESAGDVRRLSRGLNPAGLPEGDLLSVLNGLTQNVKGARLEKESDLPSLGEEEATHLYRLAQEAFSNAHRHGEADEIVIRLRNEEEILVLEVEDDGAGFDPSKTGGEGLGLRSMRHRAELLGAELTVDSTPGRGTLVRCRLPR